MKTCKDCEYSTADKYDSGECLRYPPTPLYQRTGWNYDEPIMEVQSEYPTIWKTNLACGEFIRRPK